MKIGLISDIHANLYGLKSVLSKLNDADEIYCAGDITGYYTYTNEVFDELSSHKVQFIRGNHDNYVVSDETVPRSDIMSESVNFARAHISPHNLDILKRTPETLVLTLDKLKVMIFHGSPWKMEYIYPSYPHFGRFSKLDADVIVLGHTHIPLVKSVNDKLIVNPGSCGQPRDGNPSASYALLDTKKKAASIHRVTYNTKPVINAVEQNHLNPKLSQILERQSL